MLHTGTAKTVVPNLFVSALEVHSSADGDVVVYLESLNVTRTERQKVVSFTTSNSVV
jgi:ERCC4-related helicase